MCYAGATDIITANTEVATEMGSQLLQYLGANANGVRVLVRELRKQMDNHVIELAEELASDKKQQPKDPDGYVYKVDQSLLSSAVSPPNAASSLESTLPYASIGSRLLSRMMLTFYIQLFTIIYLACRRTLETHS